MKEYKDYRIILEDLRDYLKGKGIDPFLSKGFDGEWFISAYSVHHYYSIFDGNLGIEFVNRKIVVASLSDPDYRDKFAKHLKVEAQRQSDTEKDIK